MGKSDNGKDVPPQDDVPCDSTKNKADDEADADERVTPKNRVRAMIGFCFSSQYLGGWVGDPNTS